MFELKAGVETISSGSFIINMGVSPQTVGNALKPYGLIYDLLRNNSVPIKWVINQSKVKDGIDFTYNSVVYKGGTFIIPAEYRNSAVNSKISTWVSQGVVGANTNSSFTVDVTYTLIGLPRWTLDAKNGAIAQGFLTAAGITTTAFPGAYNWKSPALLDCCDDFYVMPHAEPTWATHNRLYTWNRDCLGTIYASCHAVSALENSINPSNPSEQMNFLTQRTSATTPIPYPGNSLTLWSNHSNGTPPYVTNNAYNSDPVAQYLGTTDAIQQSGSEQIYMPIQQSTARWNSGAKILVYDATHVNVPSLQPDLRNAAAAIVYGRAMDSPTRGYVMYEGGHNVGGTSAASIAAQRAFLNFSFFQTIEKVPQIIQTGISDGAIIQSGQTLSNLHVSANSPLSGITYSYLWSSTCGGTFSASTSATTHFTAATVFSQTTCVLTCRVTDNCGRTSFVSTPITITPPPASPIAINDTIVIPNNCSPGTVSTHVLSNDTDPQATTLVFDSLLTSTINPVDAGSWSATSEGNVTLVVNPNFDGTASVQYRIHNQFNQTATATVYVVVGSVDANGCFPNSVYGIQEQNIISNIASLSGVSVGDTSALDDAEVLYSTVNTDYLNLQTTYTNNIILSIGKTLRTKDSIGIYWSKGTSGSAASISVQIGTSATGPWTNTQVFTIAASPSGTGASVNTFSSYAIPSGQTNITHVRVSPGNASTNTNSSAQVWLDAVDYEYLNCVSKVPNPSNDSYSTLEDLPAVLNVLSNDLDPQQLSLTIKDISTAPLHGNVSVNTDGTITYVNTTDYSGTDSFTYYVCNSDGRCNTAKVVMNIVDDGCSANQYKPIASGGSVTKVFQSGFTGTNAATANSSTSNFRDSYLRKDRSTTNYGTSTSISIGKRMSDSKARRGVMYFNISEIPSTAVVTSSSLSLLRKGGNSNTQTIYLQPLTQTFTENQTTWNIRSTGTNWTTAGGDYSSSISNTSVTSSLTRFTWDLGSTAQSWVSNSANNFGVLLKTDETVDARHDFSSREETTVSSRPILTITYLVPQSCANIPNRQPLARPDNAITPSGTMISIPVLSNDKDPDGNSISLSSVFSATNGTAVVNGNNIEFTPTSSYNGNATFMYRIYDGSTYDTAYAYILVTNSAPTAQNDFPSASNSGSSQSYNVGVNDSDPEGAVLTYAIYSGPRYGSATISGSTITYNPTIGFTGKDTVFYSASEPTSGCSQGLSDSAYVVFVVNNQVPVTTNLNYSTPACQSITVNLLSGSSDAEGGVLSVSSIGALSPLNAGTLVNNNDGTATFTPATGFLGSASFLYYVIDDGTPPQISTATSTVAITVSAVTNTAPVAMNDTADVLFPNQIWYQSALDNDSDPQSNKLSNPQITNNPLHGTGVVLDNGLIKYTPLPGYIGQDSLTYSVCDSVLNPLSCSISQGLCSNAKVYYTIALSDSVQAVNDINSTVKNTSVNGSVATNDFSVPSKSFSVIGSMSAGGSITMNSNGTYTYTPPSNFIGTDEVYYQVCNGGSMETCDTAMLSIHVIPTYNLSLNTIIASDDHATSLFNDSVVVCVLCNDVDPNGNTISNPSIITAPAHGLVTVNSNGSITYKPSSDYTGTDQFSYKICDNASPQVCDTAVVYVDVRFVSLQVNSTYANDDQFVLDYNVNLSGNVGSNDSDPQGNAVTFNVVSTVGHGSLNFNSNGTFSYTPSSNYTGPDRFVYSKCDNGFPSVCDTATAYILSVNPDDQPVAVSDVFTTDEDVVLSGNVSSNDTPSGDEGNVWSLIGTNGGALHGAVSMNSNGAFTFTPSANYYGLDSFTYRICDIDNDCSSSKVYITINSVNDLPTAVNDINTTNEDASVNGDVSTNDITSGDGGNTWSLNGTNGGALHGTVSMNSNGAYTYIPSSNYNGLDSFSYKICDVNNDCSFGKVVVSITSVNDLPTALNDTASLDENTTLTGNVSTNDTISGDGGNVWSLNGINGEALHGTVSMNSNGSYTYIPNGNYNGLDSFFYKLCDMDSECSYAKVTITVISTNDIPTALNDVSTTQEDTPLNGNVSTNDTASADGGNVWSLNGINGGALHGTVTMNSNGTYTYTPSANYNGADSFYYQLCDVNADCSAAKVVVTIQAVDDLPVASNDLISTDEDTPINGNVSTNDAPSGDGGNMWSLNGMNGGALHGTVSMNSNGTYTYTPDANYHGVDTISYKVCDSDGDCSTGSLIMTINSVNDIAVVVNDVNSVNEDNSVSGNASLNDMPSGDGGNVWSLVGIDGGALHGTVTMNAIGEYTYTPDADYNGLDSFSYQICDANMDCISAKVIITINAVNDVVSSSDDTYTINEDMILSDDVSGNDIASGDGGNLWSLFGLNGGAMHGAVIMNSNGTFNYTPDANYNGFDSFQYRLCDSNGDCDTSMVHVTIQAVNDVPDALSDTRGMSVNTSVNGTASGNDIPSGDGGNSWSLIGSNGGALHGTVSMNTSGSYSYIPFANYVGSDQFSYRVCDGDGDCDTSSVTLNILSDTLTLLAYPNNHFCLGTNIQLVAYGTPGATFNWTTPVGFTGTIDNSVSGQSIITIENLSSPNNGVYTVTQTYLSQTTLPRTLTVNAGAQATFNYVQTSCVSGMGQVNLNVNPSAGMEYSINGGAYQNSPVFTVPAGSTFIATARPIGTSCVSTYSGNCVYCQGASGCTTPPKDSLVVSPWNCTPAPITITNYFSNASSVTFTSSGAGVFDQSTCNSSPCTVHYYAAIQDLNSSEVIITATTNDPDGAGPCVSSISSKMVQLLNGLVAPTVITNSPVCENSAFTFSQNSLVGNVSWSGVNGFTSSKRQDTILNTPASLQGLFTSTLSANGCMNVSATKQVNVIAAPNLNVVVTPLDELCAGQGNGSIQVSVSGGSGLYEICYNGNLSNCDTGANANFQYVAPGNYTVTVVDQACPNNIFSYPVTIHTGATVLDPVVPSNITACSGGSLVLSGTSSGTINWTFTGNNFNALGNTVTRFNAQTWMSGTYIAKTIGTNGCASLGVWITVSVGASPVINHVQVNCKGDTAKITITASGPGTLSYSLNGINYQSSNNFDGTPGGDYILYVKTLPTGCITTLPVHVPNCACPNEPIITINHASNSCGLTSIPLVASWTNSPTATWSTNGTGSFNVSGGSSPLSNYYTPSALDLSNGGVDLTLTTPDPDGADPCSAVSKLIHINLLSGLSAPVITPNQSTYCSGDTVMLSTNSSLPLHWSGPGGFSSDSTVLWIPSATQFLSGAYTAHISGNGCTSASTVFNLLVSSPPNLTVSTTTIDENCEGHGNGQITVNVTGGSGVYKICDDFEINCNTTTAPYSFKYLAPQTYTIYVSDATCLNDRTSTVTTVNPGAHVPPPTSASYNSGTLCEGDDLILTVTGSGSQEFLWTDKTNNWTSYGSVVTRTNAVPAMSGPYSVVQVNDGCASDPLYLDVLIGEFPEIIGIDTACGGGDMGIITVHASNSSSQLLEYAINDEPYQSSNVFDSLPNGLYQIKVRSVGTQCENMINGIELYCSCFCERDGLATIFPNPNTGSFTVNLELKEASDNIKLELFDISGRRIYTEFTEEKSHFLRHNLNIEHLEAGTYTLKIRVDSSNYLLPISVTSK